MKPSICLLAILWSTSVSASHPLDAAKRQLDKERIQGTWSIVSFEESGNRLPGKAAANVHVVITDKMVLFKNDGQDGISFEYTLDPTKNPKIIDTTHEIDPGKPIKQMGIYSLSDDTLTLCIAAAGRARPTSLTDDETSIFVLKRLESQLVGAWVLAGAAEAVGDAPEAGGRLRFFTGKHWCVTEYNAETGFVKFHHGGTYHVDSGYLVEEIEFATESSADLLRAKRTLRVAVVGDSMTLFSVGGRPAEVWKRKP